MATFHFDLVSPEKLLFSGDVDQVDVPGAEGDFGVLAGHAPDLQDFLDSLGISAADAAYYNDCFQDGAVLLIVGSQVSGDQRRALDLILRHGGILPPSCELLRTAM